MNKTFMVILFGMLRHGHQERDQEKIIWMRRAIRDYQDGLSTIEEILDATTISVVFSDSPPYEQVS